MDPMTGLHALVMPANVNILQEVWLKVENMPLESEQKMPLVSLMHLRASMLKPDHHMIPLAHLGSQRLLLTLSLQPILPGLRQQKLEDEKSWDTTLRDEKLAMNGQELTTILAQRLTTQFQD